MTHSQQTQTTTLMVKNYFKIALRTFSKSKLTSLINIGSLAVGIACCIIIILFVKNEWTFDQFHSKKDRIYRIYDLVESRGQGLQTQVYTPYNMTRLMAADYDELEAYSTLSSFSQQVEYEEQNFAETITMVSEGFFTIFDYPILSGSTNKVLNGLDDVVITKAIAEKYFGTSNAVGEQLRMTLGEENKSFTVRAVLDEIPSNSSLRFDFLISDENARLVYPDPMINTWHMISGVNYVLLKEGVDPSTFEAKLPAMVDKVLGEDRERQFSIHLQPLTDIHLNNEFPAGFATVSDPKYTFILTGIALLILLLGCVNFMILSVGKSAARAKEIGVRKVVGASRNQLSRQLISEGVLLALFSLIIALGIARLALPMFNELANNNLKMNLTWDNVLIFLGLALIVGLMASLYPAFVISSFRPSKVLKGNLGEGGKKHYFKLFLVTGQFVLSIFLVSTTVLMQKQLHFLQNKNLGFDAEQVLSIPVGAPGARGLRESISQGMERAQLLKTKLASNSDIMDLGISAQNFGTEGWIQLGWNEPDTEELRQFRVNVVDAGYIPSMKMELLMGRNFEVDNLSDQRRGVIVNEAFLREFDIDDPIGAKIPNPNAADHEIIGVVKDFHFASLHNTIEPLILVQNVEIGFSVATTASIEADPAPKVVVRIAPNAFEEVIEAIESDWVTVYGDEPFDYTFMDDGLKQQYESEQNLGKIVSAATTIALIIGCMGLFALATLTMNARIKEISVRKVLGAPMKNILYLLSRSYIIIILVALIISVPMTIYFAESWLSEFEYRIPVGIDSFLLAGFATLIIAMITIGYQCLKVASANPARTLSAE